MSEIQEIHIAIKRINNNRFIVNNKTFDYLQLITWLKDAVTEPRITAKQ